MFCGAGEQSSPSEDLCEPCPVGKIKPSASHDQCADCPIDRSSNDERTACSVCKFIFSYSSTLVIQNIQFEFQ